MQKNLEGDAVGPSKTDTCSYTHAAEVRCVFLVHVLARRKALCPWLGVGLRVSWEGTMFLLVLSNAKFIGYHLQGGGVWVVARPKKGF